MHLSKLSIEPRLRNGWQAIDLGFAMARQWWWPSFLVWAIPSFLLYLVFSFVFPAYAWLSVALVWWLKPLWDRLPLVLASRALFSEPLDVQATLRNSLKIFKIDCFASLTWRRFSPSRSFDLPITVLEGLRGAERSRRLTVLHQSYGNAAVWLTLVLVHIEMFLSLGIWSAAVLLIPEELDVDWLGIMLSEDMLAVHLANLITLSAMTLVGPFYSLAGFALYICRRVELEAWDIEIRFRHLAERYRKPGPKPVASKAANKAAACLLPLLIASLAMTNAPESWAEQGANDEPAFVQQYYQKLDAYPPAAKAKQTVVDVLGGEDFYRIDTEIGWRFKKFGDENTEGVPEWLLSTADFFDWVRTITAPLQRVFTGLAGGFELLVWLLVVGVLGLIIYRYRKGLLSAFGVRLRSSRAQQPELLFGLDVRKESLPDDVCGQVQTWWGKGRHREAIGLLYRATLSRLIHRFAFEFYAGYTEQECESVVKQGNNKVMSDYLSQLTRVWQQLAYAHRLPDSAQVKGLCDQWQTLFREPQDHAR